MSEKLLGPSVKCLFPLLLLRCQKKRLMGRKRKRVFKIVGGWSRKEKARSQSQALILSSSLYPESSRTGRSTFSRCYYLDLCFFFFFLIYIIIDATPLLQREWWLGRETFCHLSILFWKDRGNRAKTGNEPLYLLALLEKVWEEEWCLQPK